MSASEFRARLSMPGTHYTRVLRNGFGQPIALEAIDAKRVTIIRTDCVDQHLVAYRVDERTMVRPDDMLVVVG